MCDYNAIVEIEPAVLIIYNMPIGTDLTLVRDGKKKAFIDTVSGAKVVFD